MLEKDFFMKIYIFGIFGPKTLAGSNIGVCHKYRKPFLTEITHRKIVRKSFFIKIDIFGIFGPKTENMLA